MSKTKKIILMVGGGLLALLLLLVLIELFFPAPPAPEGQSDYFDSRLEELRDRSAELDEIFDGSAEYVETEQADNDLFVDQGELSDFDSFPPPVVEREGGTLDAQPDDLGLDVQDPAATALDPMPRSSVENADQVLLAAFDDDAAPAPARSALSKDEIKDLVNDAVEAALQQFSQHNSASDSVLDSLAEQQREIGSLKNRIAEMPEVAREIVLEALEMQGHSDFVVMLSALSERVEDLQRAQRSQSQQAARPSASQLRNLYRIERITGNTATLVGTNTGREFAFGQGDTLAYGGTVTGIRGDSVTLSWPEAQVTLSIY